VDAPTSAKTPLPDMPLCEPVLSFSQTPRAKGHRRGLEPAAVVEISRPDWDAAHLPTYLRSDALRRVGRT